MSPATSVTVSTTSGAVQGVRTGGVVAFLGIPYAAAPVGERRFRAPEPAPRWSGVRDAVAHGPTAPMPGYLLALGGFGGAALWVISCWRRRSPCWRR